MDLVLIGYQWPVRPKIVMDCSFTSRQELWREGYSVDAITRGEALEIEALFEATDAK